MNNPFEVIEARLSCIENLILDLKHPPRDLGHFPKNENPFKKEDELYNIQGAADFLHLKVPTIYSKVSRGELKNMKRGKRLYFSKLDLIEYLEEGRRKTNSEIKAEASSFLSNQKKGGLSNG